MRDISAALDHVIDPVTGSELLYVVFDTSKEGGYVFRFLFRPEPDVAASAFRVLLNPYTGLEMAAHRARQGLPDFESGREEDRYFKQFVEDFGFFYAVSELDLLEETAVAGPKAVGTPGCWLVDWDSLSTAAILALVDALTRTIFLARSRRTMEDGFYPDHLTVKPYGMPGQFVTHARANEFMEP